MKPALLILTAAAAAGSAVVALAHPLPKVVVPAPNAVLAASPPEIRITFSEPLVAAFSGLELKDSTGKAVALGASSVGPKDKKQLSAAVGAPLAAGTYTVAWHAVSTDTHHVAGHYSFQVKP